MSSILSTLNTDLSKYASLSFIPSEYRWLVPIGIVVFGLVMLFFSDKAWKITVAAVGFIGGFMAMQYYAIPYLTTIIPVSGGSFVFSMLGHAADVPTWYFSVIVAVLSYVILYFLIRFAISAAIGYGAFLAVSHFGYHLSVAILIAVVVFGIAFALYRKIAILIAKAVGTASIYFGLVVFGVPSEYAIIVSLVMLLIASVLMIGKKKIKAWFAGHKAAGKSKKGVNRDMKLPKISGIIGKLKPKEKEQESAGVHVTKDGVEKS